MIPLIQKEEVIELDKIKITLTTTKNQKDEEKNINETTIDLNDCENKLKEIYILNIIEQIY